MKLLVIICGLGGLQNRIRTKPAPVQRGDDVEGVRAGDTKIQGTLEPNVTTAIVGFVLNRTVTVLTRNEEIPSGVDLAVPGHAGDLGWITGRTGKEFRRRAGFDSAIVFATDKPSPLEFGDINPCVVRVGLGAVVVSRIGIRFANLGCMERRREVAIEGRSHRGLFELAPNLAPEIATIALSDDVHVQGPVLLEPRIIDELIPGLGRSDPAETFVERLAVATGLAGTFIRGHADFLFRNGRELEQLLEVHEGTSNWSVLKNRGEPRSRLGIRTNRSLNETLARDVDVRRPIPDVSSIEDILEHPNLGLDVLARRHQISFHEVLKSREEPKVRRREILPVQNRIGRALVDIEDVFERILGNPVGPSFLPNKRRLLDLNDSHGLAHVRRPLNRIGQERSECLPALPCFGLCFDEVVRKLVVFVLILFRPHIAEVLIDGRKRL